MVLRDVFLLKQESDFNIYLTHIALINTVFPIERFKSLQTSYYYSTED